MDMFQDTVEPSIPAWLTDGLNQNTVFTGRITGFRGLGAFVVVNGASGLLNQGDYSDDYCQIIERYKIGDQIEVLCKSAKVVGEKLYIRWTVPVKAHRTEPFRCTLRVGDAVRGTAVSVRDFPAGKVVFLRTADGGDLLNIMCAANGTDGREVELNQTCWIRIIAITPSDDVTQPPTVRGRVITEAQAADSRRFFEVKRGQIWWADLPCDGGSNIKYGVRPVVIVSNDNSNRVSSFVTVVPLDVGEKKSYLATNVHIGADAHEGWDTALCNQLISLDKTRLCAYLGSVTDESTQAALDQAIRLQLGLSS